MEKKILFGTLGGALAGFIASMIVFMGIFGGMAEQWMAEHGACLKEMNMVWWVVATLFYGLLYAWLLHKLGADTFKSGALNAMWVALLIGLIMGLSNASTYTAYPWSWLPYDVISNVITTGIAGGVIGWIYGKMK